MRNPSILVVDTGRDVADQIERLADRLRPRANVESCPPGSFDDVIDERGPFDVLVAGPSMANRSCLGRLAMVHAERPGLSIVLAFKEKPDAKLREVVRTGAVDLLQLPVEAHFLLETMERAIAMSGQHPAEEPDARSAPAPSSGGGVLTVTSAGGGSGKTFLATNIAYFLQQHGKRTCIVDLDMEFGEVPTALRLRPKYTIVDLLARDEGGEGDLAPFVDEHVVAHATGISVLAGPKDPSDGDRVQPADVLRVLQALSSRFDYLVIDTPGGLSPLMQTALDLSDAIYLISTLDTLSLHSMGVYLGTLDKLQIETEIRLVVNKEERELGIDLAQVVKVLDRQFSVVLPYGSEVTRSLNVGTPLLAFMPSSPVSRALVAGLGPLAAGDDRPAEDGAARAAASGLRRWFGLGRSRSTSPALTAGR